MLLAIRLYLCLNTELVIFFLTYGLDRICLRLTLYVDLRTIGIEVEQIVDTFGSDEVTPANQLSGH